MRERRKLSYAGVVSISLCFNQRGVLTDSPGVSAFGAALGTKHDDAELDDLADAIEEAVLDMAPTKRKDDEAVELAAKRAMRGYCDRVWGKSPYMLIHIHRSHA